MKDNTSVHYLVRNRKARFTFFIESTVEAGIVLTGTEIKSIRHHGASLEGSYARVKNGEAWLMGSTIAPYSFGNRYNHEETRDRKLLLHKREIIRMKQATRESGRTLVPLSLYLKKGKVKVELALARGKTHRDQRQTIRTREEERSIRDVLRK